MPKLIVTINQECCRCQTKIQKVLTCLQDEFCIEKIEFEKCSKVTITGKFDADNLSGRLRCKAGKFIKNIEVDDGKEDEKKKMPKLIVTINQECCRWQTKIQNVLTCLQAEFSIEKIEFEKSGKVTITGKFDADNLSCRLWCMAGNFIKNIEKVDDKKKKGGKKKEPPCQFVHVYPWSYPPCPYPNQLPYGACPSCYPQQCQCYYSCKPPPCACAKCSRSSSCSGDHHGGGDGCGSSSSSKPVPYALPAPLIVCEDNNPSYACSVM